MDPIITNALMTFGAGFATAALTKAKGPGQALDDLMTLVGFDRLHEVAEKKRIKRDRDLLEYKNTIAQKIAMIPEDNIQDPPLAIVGPALEASKFYIEESVLREMFANLIASAMDSSKDQTTHSSFVEIIKQMEPLDAQNLLLISEKGTNELICAIQNYSDTNRFTTYFRNLYLSNPNCNDYAILSSSIQNLDRLGLVEITYDEFRQPESVYDIFTESQEYFDATDSILRVNHDKLATMTSESPNYELFSKPKIQKGLVRLTPFGENFCTTCL